MPISILRGPAGGGKSQYFEENSEKGDLLIDLTSLWASLLALERDPVTGLFPLRLDGSPALRVAAYLKSTAIRFAARENFNSWVTTSNSSPVAVERLREIIGASTGTGTGAGAGAGRIVTVGGDLTERQIMSRLANPVTGETSEECQKAARRWFRR